MKRLLFLFLIFIACAPRMFLIDYDKVPQDVKTWYGSDIALSKRCYLLDEMGLPIETDKGSVFRIEDMFREAPCDTETWFWENGSYVFKSLASLWLQGHATPRRRGGDLSIQILDTCMIGDVFCVEFVVDGLTRGNRRQALYKVQVLVKKKKRWLYLYDTSPIYSYARSLLFVAFIEPGDLRKLKIKSKEVLIMIVVKDFVTKNTERAVFNLSF